MQERMRGAGRHEVADESFGFILPVEEASEPPAPVTEPTPTPPAPRASLTRSDPNTSAKRRRPKAESKSARLQSSSKQPEEPLSQSVGSKRDPYDLGQDTSREEESVIVSPARETDEHAQAEIEVGSNEVEDNFESLPQTVLRPKSRESVSSRQSTGRYVTEEVTESPATAPGSGHRRRIRVDNVTTQSAHLQRMVLDQEAGDTGELATSSPLARKTRLSGVTPNAFSTRSTRTTGRSALARSAIDADQLSPLPLRPRKSDSTNNSGSARSSLSTAQRSILSAINDEPDELSSPVPLLESRRRAQAARMKTKPKAKINAARPSKPVTKAADIPEGDGEEPQLGEAVGEGAAEQIEATEAARIIGRKRPRPSPPREESPELDVPRVESTRPTKKQRKTGAQRSPAQQSQPTVAPRKQSKEKQKRKRHSGENEDVPIVVQRYTRPQHHNENDTDADILSADIPFANRSGVNVINVLGQMCDEVIDSNLAILHEAAINADNSITKREYRTKLRALEAFQEELRTRFLEHAIALDTLHALKKRVRSIQKQKLALRNDIISIRAEREQVALKMDAVRVRHETESKQTLVSISLGGLCLPILIFRQDQLNLSSTMHDIDLAVENGRQAPELGLKEQKAAELANLELLVARVAGQVVTETGSGNLKQFQEFNSFLERAAAALEAR